jgi:hypothetical protein
MARVQLVRLEQLRGVDNIFYREGRASTCI